MPPSGSIAFDWRSIKKWCLLATIVMFVWLMIPVAQCSIQAFRDTPLSEVNPHDQTPPAPDEEPAEEPGFFSKLSDACRICYARTPLFGQEEWKHYLLVGFAGLTVFAWVLAYLDANKRRSFGD